MTIRDQIPKGTRFAKLPVDAILDTRLSDSDVRVLAYLLSRTSEWKVFVSQVAKELKVSARTVRRSIVRLQEAGYAWRRVEKIGGLVRYPDIVISAVPRAASTVRLDGYQNCPNERTPLSTNADKSVHEVRDTADRLTQIEFFTQSNITQTEDTQSVEVSADSAGEETVHQNEAESV